MTFCTKALVVGGSIHRLANGRSRSDEVRMVFQAVLCHQIWSRETYSTSYFQTVAHRTVLATQQPVLARSVARRSSHSLHLAIHLALAFQLADLSLLEWSGLLQDLDLQRFMQQASPCHLKAFGALILAAASLHA